MWVTLVQAVQHWSAAMQEWICVYSLLQTAEISNTCISLIVKKQMSYSSDIEPSYTDLTLLEITVTLL